MKVEQLTKVRLCRPGIPDAEGTNGAWWLLRCADEPGASGSFVPLGGWRSADTPLDVTLHLQPGLYKLGAGSRSKHAWAWSMEFEVDPSARLPCASVGCSDTVPLVIGASGYDPDSLDPPPSERVCGRCPIEHRHRVKAKRELAKSRVQRDAEQARTDAYISGALSCANTRRRPL